MTHCSIRFFFFLFRTAEERQGNGGERREDMQQRTSGQIRNPGHWQGLSLHGACVLPGEPEATVDIKILVTAALMIYLIQNWI